MVRNAERTARWPRTEQIQVVYNFPLGGYALTTSSPFAMAWNDVALEITEQADSEIISGIRNALEESAVTMNALTFQTAFGPTITASDGEIESNTSLQDLLGKKSTLAQTVSVSVQFPNLPAWIIFCRNENVSVPKLGSETK